jgi:SAM-dependent methyltransferase
MDEQITINLLKEKFGGVGKFLYRIYTEPAYSGVIQDLVAYTGLDVMEVFAKAILNLEDVGHFVREFQFYKPKKEAQLTWFYRSALGYLFGNIQRPFWEKLKFIEKKHEPILDYGGGIGNNTIPLASKGIHVDYFDVSIIQRDFVNFRARNRRAIGSNLKLLDGISQFRFDYLKFIENLCSNYYGVICLQDVLEHIPNYQNLLKILCSKLRKGGLIAEHTPFNSDKLNSPMHFSQNFSLEKAMEENRLFRLNNSEEEKGIWIKQ